MRRIAFLFGAGASYGAGAILPRPPPLGADLYGELRMAYPATWGNLSSDLADCFERDFEVGMDTLWRSPDQEQSQPLMEIARYFAGFHTDPSQLPSCYLRLIQLLESVHLIEQCGFATLNYDCILDLDLDTAGFGYSDGVRSGPFRHRREVPLWKLHGACNVLPATGTNTFTGTRFFSIGGQLFAGPVEYVTPARVIENCDSDGLPLMISLYAPGKPTPVAADAVKGIREGWESWVKRSDVIVVIGARVLHKDRHIYTPLKKAPGEIWYVGDSNGFQIRKRQVLRLARRFDEALEGELTKRILSVARSR